MTTITTVTFDFQELYLALDAERERRVLSWQGIAKEMGPSASTLKNTAKSDSMGADGVVAMLQWLGIPASTFVRGGDPPPDLATQVETLLRAREDLSADAVSELVGIVREACEPLRTPRAKAVDRLPIEPRHEILGYKRIHIGGIYAALDAKREAEGLTWKQVVERVHPQLETPSTLKRFAKGGRTVFPGILYRLHWIGLPVEVFLRRLAPPEYRNEEELPQANMMKQIDVLLRLREDLTDEGATELEGVVAAEYNRLRDES